MIVAIGYVQSIKGCCGIVAACRCELLGFPGVQRRLWSVKLCCRPPQEGYRTTSGSTTCSGPEKGSRKASSSLREMRGLVLGCGFSSSRAFVRSLCTSFSLLGKPVPAILGYFQSIIGYIGVYWPIVSGSLTFQAGWRVLSRCKGG